MHYTNNKIHQIITFSNWSKKISLYKFYKTITKTIYWKLMTIVFIYTIYLWYVDFSLSNTITYIFSLILSISNKIRIKKMTYYLNSLIHGLDQKGSSPSSFTSFTSCPRSCTSTFALKYNNAFRHNWTRFSSENKNNNQLITINQLIL